MDNQQRATATSLDLVRSATLGFVAGLRSVMPLALLAVHLQRKRADLAEGGWAVDVLASAWGTVGLGVAAVGEVVADKLPIIPSRLEPLPLAGRVVLGGAAGALQSLAEGRAADVGAPGASIGALVGSVVGYQLRTGLQRRLGLPGLVVALAEDGLAFGLGRWAVRRQVGPRSAPGRASSLPEGSHPLRDEHRKPPRPHWAASAAVGWAVAPSQAHRPPPVTPVSRLGL